MNEVMENSFIHSFKWRILLLLAIYLSLSMFLVAESTTFVILTTAVDASVWDPCFVVVIVVLHSSSRAMLSRAILFVFCFDVGDNDFAFVIPYRSDEIT